MKLIADFSEKELLSHHQYQFDGSHRNRNECGLCSMSMLLNLGATLLNEELEIDPSSFGKELDRIPFRHPRFPAWFPGPGGATHPRAALKGMQQKILALRQQGHAFPLWPVAKKKQSLNNLEEELTAGHPTLIYGVGQSGIPHVVVPLAREQQGWKILDPGFPTLRNPLIWSDRKLLEWWKNYGLIYPAGTMISLIPQIKAKE